MEILDTFDAVTTEKVLSRLNKLTSASQPQ